MSTRTTTFLTLGMILIALAVSAMLAARLPDPMASHWDAQGQVDGYIPRFWGLFLMPLVAVGMLALFQIIPRIDPLAENVALFRSQFNTFIALLIAFLLYIHGLTLAWNLGYTSFDMGTAILPALGLLFIYIGVLLKGARRNWFIGIRTPWTLSSDAVWEATHRRGSWLYIATGGLTLLGVFFNNYAIWFIMIPVIGVSLYLIFYSYVLWRREQLH